MNEWTERIRTIIRLRKKGTFIFWNQRSHALTLSDKYTAFALFNRVELFACHQSIFSERLVFLCLPLTPEYLQASLLTLAASSGGQAMHFREISRAALTSMEREDLFEKGCQNKKIIKWTNNLVFSISLLPRKNYFSAFYSTWVCGNILVIFFVNHGLLNPRADA